MIGRIPPIISYTHLIPQSVAADEVPVRQVNFSSADELQQILPEVVHDCAVQPAGVVASHIYVELVSL